MSTNYTNILKKSESSKNYQPDFPLRYDNRSGPYTPITDKTDSLAKNFVNLLMTNPGEWPMNPDLGIGIKTYLFEQSSASISQSLRPRIIKQLEKYLPHIKLHSLKIEMSDNDIDGNRVKIRINCVIMNTTYASMVAYLDRLAKLVIDYKKLKKSFENNVSLVPRLDTDLFSRQLVL